MRRCRRMRRGHLCMDGIVEGARILDEVTTDWGIVFIAIYCFANCLSNRFVRSCYNLRRLVLWRSSIRLFLLYSPWPLRSGMFC